MVSILLLYSPVFTVELNTQSGVFFFFLYIATAIAVVGGELTELLTSQRLWSNGVVKIWFLTKYTSLLPFSFSLTL